MSVEKMIADHQKNDFSQHEEIRKQNLKQSESIEKLTLAMFGDPLTRDKGTKEKVDEMYEILVAGGVIRKTLAWVFGVLVALMGAATMVTSFLKDIREK